MHDGENQTKDEQKKSSWSIYLAMFQTRLDQHNALWEIPPRLQYVLIFFPTVSRLPNNKDDPRFLIMSHLMRCEKSSKQFSCHSITGSLVNA